MRRKIREPNNRVATTYRVTELCLGGVYGTPAIKPLNAGWFMGSQSFDV